MKVKRYLVNDLPEAVQMIRSELGSDAVILNTKEIRIGGFLGMFRKKRVEVIAAVDEAAAKPKPRQQAKASPLASAPAVLASAATAKQTAQASAAVAAVAAAGASWPAAAEAGGGIAIAAEPEAPAAAWVPPAVARGRYSAAAPSAPPQANAAAKPAPQTIAAAAPPRAAADEEAAMEILAALAQAAKPEAKAPAMAEEAAAARPALAAIEPAATQAVRAESPLTAVSANAAEAYPSGKSNPEANSDTAALLQEIRAMREMMLQASRQQMFRSLPDEVMALSRQLAKQGVDPKYVQQFAEEVGERLAAKEESGEAAAMEEARAVLRQWLLPAAGTGISETTRIVNFVGPTGVGKTTTIAKLAADQAFVHRRSVGFITADTYRIAAVDQLRTYADILNIPLEVVFSSSELTRAYNKLEERDLIFMDTAGRNYRNELFVSEVNSLLAPGQQAESMLVLSLTHKYDDMRQVAEQFAKYGVRRLLFTKLDETDSVGCILNLAREFGFEITYITCGQTVPDDIRSFDPDEIVGRLLGEITHA
ncbi:flagellar biosynthesis protein FlhF [Cohnella lubricantis]|uniref:Flagellar biosynthesis protein FlhF n=1 Tax=Cohnella lubricantis TaxID=2163172 RepID=A0A841TKC9_9BACL|nr:flagellar biosynthesis protein FlhF [Cohnella lubricantis]MBB6679397.1 flagellar biosynthesis protein FlhF [Cohnella lubricantis]MBP2117479.1 flagellar biosynthesis protein FlhF [Cohnella lubricantis]